MFQPRSWSLVANFSCDQPFFKRHFFTCGPITFFWELFTKCEVSALVVKNCVHTHNYCFANVTSLSLHSWKTGLKLCESAGENYPTILADGAKQGQSLGFPFNLHTPRASRASAYRRFPNQTLQSN